jgi:hypothetical protein
VFSVVSNGLNRNEDITKEHGICFRFDKEKDLHVSCPPKVKEPREKTRKETPTEKLAKKVFEDGKRVFKDGKDWGDKNDKGQLVSALMRVGGLSKQAAQKKMGKMKDAGLYKVAHRYLSLSRHLASCYVKSKEAIIDGETVRVPIEDGKGGYEWEEIKHPAATAAAPEPAPEE